MPSLQGIKTHQIVDYLIENDLSLCAITEFWLKPEDDVAMGELEPAEYKLDPIHRHHKRGGGIAIVHQHTLKAKILVSTAHTSSWKLLFQRAQTQLSC